MRKHLVKESLEDEIARVEGRTGDVSIGMRRVEREVDEKAGEVEVDY